MARRDGKNGKIQDPPSRRRDLRLRLAAGVIPPPVLRGVVGGDQGYANLVPTYDPGPPLPIRG
jgi:hypothetical protein